MPDLSFVIPTITVLFQKCVWIQVPNTAFSSCIGARHGELRQVRVQRDEDGNPEVLRNITEKLIFRWVVVSVLIHLWGSRLDLGEHSRHEAGDSPICETICVSLRFLRDLCDTHVTFESFALSRKCGVVHTAVFMKDYCNGNPIVSGSRGECCAKVIHAVIADVGYPNLLLVATGRPVPFLVEVALWGDYI